MKKKARDFAINAHKGQQYGNHPYVLHLDAVAHLLQPFGETAVVLGYLHDVLEDTPVSLTQVEQEFGPLIANRLTLLTDEQGANRKERKRKTYEKLSRLPQDMDGVLAVKVADRLANVRASLDDGNVKLLKMYLAEHASFRQAVFRQGSCDDLWHQLNDLLVQALETVKPPV
jgi:(p)ppGpp synthase/HD superfamily hydrolase